MGYRERNNNYPGTRPGAFMQPEICHEEKKCEEQRHVHELQGSVKIADEEEPHNHRFCTVTCEAIPFGEGDHVHEVVFRTDFFEDHFHEFKGRTGCAIPVGGGHHVHFIDSVTTVNDGHRHAFEAATLIEDPIKKGCKKDEHHHRDDYYRR
jgi:hypothetical protein